MKIDALLFIPGEAEGALKNGTRIVKVKEGRGDINPLGTKGTVRASHRAGEQLGYFVEWDTMQGVPALVIDWKIAADKLS